MNGNGQQPQMQPQQPMTQEQYQVALAAYNRQQTLNLISRRMAYIKSELHQAVNIISLRDRVRELAELIEFALIGRVQDAQPNIVPGIPAHQIDDPSKTRVEFTSGPGAALQHQQRVEQQNQGNNWQPVLDPFAAPPAPPPRQVGPVNSGDVHFIPGPPPGTSTGVGGQKVEFVDQYGRPVDANGKPIVDQNAAPDLPRTPVSNQPQQIGTNMPTRTVEAGGFVHPTVPPTIPVTPTGFLSSPAAGEIFPGNPPLPPPPGAPTTLEEARQVLPIPVMEG